MLSWYMSYGQGKSVVIAFLFALKPYGLEKPNYHPSKTTRSIYHNYLNLIVELDSEIAEINDYLLVEVKLLPISKVIV